MRPLLIVILFLGGSCGGRAHPERGGEAAESKESKDLVIDEETARATAAGLLEVLETMAAIAEQRAGDCPAMAAELSALFDQTGPLVEIVEAAKLDPEASRLLTEAFEEHELAVPALEERISAGLATCQLDADVSAALKKMPVF
jgi:hypothetical protein